MSGAALASVPRTSIAQAVDEAVGGGKAFLFESHMLREVWQSVSDEADWLWAVIAGEFADNRPVSALISEALLGFVPGVAIVQALRDAAAIILRLIMHPEKRDDWLEWVLLSVNLVVVALPVVSAAAGAVAGLGVAVVGSLAGAAGGLLAGSELGAFLRALMLTLAHNGKSLAWVVGKLSRFVKGDVMKLLRAFKASEMVQPLIQLLKAVVGQCVKLIVAVKVKLQKLLAYILDIPFVSEGIDTLKQLIAHLAAWEQRFYGFQKDAIDKLPLAMTRLQQEVIRLLSSALPPDAHLATAGVPAKVHTTAQIKPQRVRSTHGDPLREHETKMLSQAVDDAPGSGAASAGAVGAAKKSELKSPTPAEIPKAEEPVVKAKDDSATDSGGTSSAGKAAESEAPADTQELKAKPDSPTPAEDGLQNAKRKDAENTSSSVARLKRLDELATDPAQGNKITPKTKREAEVGLAMEERGDLVAPITREPTGKAEFVDGNGQQWDVKAFNSKYAPKGYNTEVATQKILGEIETGEHVIIDTQNMSAAHIEDLKSSLGSLGLLDKVKFF